MIINIATSTFSAYSNEPLKLLENFSEKINFNPFSRTLDENELIEFALDADGIIAGNEKYDKSVINKLKNLKVISRLGVGIDSIDYKYAQEKGIKIYKNSISPAPAVAELVLGLMISISRDIPKSDNIVRSGNWEKRMGSLLQNKTLGIIGLGTIGKNLVKLTSGFNFNILAFDKEKDGDFIKKYNIKYCDLNYLLSNSDIISIHLNLSKETNNLINDKKIKLMKSKAILINASRGNIIDEKALFYALKSKKIAGAALDVFSSEPYSGSLLKLNNIIFTPHIGSYAKEIRIKMEKESAENLIRGLNEK